MSVQTITRKSVGGYLLEESSGKIVSIAAPGSGRKISVGNTVIANGRMFVPDGTTGVVEEIIEPFTKGCSSDVIMVRFGGRSGQILGMKFKDLRR